MDGERRDTAKIGGFRGNGLDRPVAGKVPEITLGFWVINFLATTLGDTSGNAVSMSLDLGFAMSSVLSLEVFAAAVAAQIAVRRFHPFLFWFVIAAAAAATAGITLADFFQRSLAIGYAGGAVLLLGLLAAAFALWYRVTGSLSIARIASPTAELFYWGTILLSQTLGTALGDWMADGTGLGIRGAALVFVAGLAVVAAIYVFTGVSRTLLFWCAFVLTRPLGAALGDWLDRPAAAGGLDLDRLPVSALLLAAILICIVELPQRPAR